MKAALILVSLFSLAPSDRTPIAPVQRAQCVSCTVNSPCGVLPGCMINGRCKPEMACPQ